MITTVFAEIEKHLDSEVLLMLSGGSVLTQLPELFSELAGLETIQLRNLTITLVDERWNANSDHADSNWRQLVQVQGFDNLAKLGVNLHPVLDGSSLDLNAEHFNNFLQSFQGKYIVAIMGIGVDGHTAGVLPHAADRTMDFWQGKVIGYDIQDYAMTNPHRYRITPDLKWLQENIDSCFVLAMGVEKRAKIEELSSLIARKSSQLSVEQYAAFPASVLATIPETQLFTDQPLSV